MYIIYNIVGLPIDIDKVGENVYLNLKNITFQLFKSFVQQVSAMTQDINFADKYFKLDISKRNSMEDLSMQLVLSLISFYKNNFDFLEKFDFQIGTCNGNEFTNTYASEIDKGLKYIAQIHQIPNEEIFKATCEFWYWFCFKVCFLQLGACNPDDGIPAIVYESSLQQYILYTNNSFYYQNCYFSVLNDVRHTLITKMTKPIEVKIDIDEDGELIADPTINTIYQTLHETMRDTLVFLTHLDPALTEKIMIDLLQTQTVDEQWNPMLLNSLCWAIGSITGSMEDNHEKKFLVMVIKHLLNLCEMKKGKTNKAIVASNIMYVVGQYPRFLNSHWKFLKTVIKKLFEFMHEFHPGVQDFACETFLKISIKCGEQFVINNDGEGEAYINVLVRSIKDDSGDLQFHQKLMFYEAIGNMISKCEDYKVKGHLVQTMMQTLWSEWNYIFNQAGQNMSILMDNKNIKNIEAMIKLNERVCLATRTVYWEFGQFIFTHLMNSYTFFSNVSNEALNTGNLYNPPVQIFKSIKKSILRFLITLINTNDSIDIIMTNILPSLASLIDQYRISHIDNRDPDVLIVFSSILEKIKDTQYDYIVSIWNYLCLFTLDMIKADFISYPEHRMNYFTLIKSLIANAFNCNID
jgi:exportin-1